MTGGFALFDRGHITWLVFIACICILMLRAGRKGGKIREKMKTGAALAALIFQLLQGIVRIAEGIYGMDTLPLHICSLACYGVFLHRMAVLRGLRMPAVSQIFYYPMLPGAAAALLFPDWTEYGVFSFLSAGGFIVHGAIVVYIMLCLADGSIRPDIRKWWAPVVFFILYAAVILPFDLHFSMNYGFLNVPSPGSPLVFLAEIFGHGRGYLAGYAAGYVLLEFICYGIAGVLLKSGAENEKNR